MPGFDLDHRLPIGGGKENDGAQCAGQAKVTVKDLAGATSGDLE
jgi:hypothetical protein